MYGFTPMSFNVQRASSQPFSAALQQTRDIFLFQCFTALRVSDLKKLKKYHIKRIDDRVYSIKILTKKDMDRVGYKFPNPASTIYERYSMY